MNRLFYLTVFLLIYFVQGQSVYSQAQTGDFTISYTDRGVTSYIYCYVPSDYDSTKSYPMLLAWHGAGDGGNNMRNAVKIWLAIAVNAILVCPDANIVNGMDVSYFYNLGKCAYDTTMKLYNIDTNKRIIMGFSWGGQWSYNYGLLNPSMFKGIIGLAPAIGSLTAEQWTNTSKLRMATILGTLDFNYTAVKKLMDSIKSRGADLLFIIKQGVQHVDNTYFNSEEIKVDFKTCYDYVINEPSIVQEQTKDVSNDLNIYPNPANDFINIEVPEFSKYKIVEIYNIFGQKVVEHEYTGRIIISLLPAGVYFLKSGGKVYRFVKM